MHMIVVGCGRVGSTIARELAAAGHEVVVVDRNPEAFRRLGESFPGRTVVGIGFDRDVLTQAGISENSAVMAVTSGDNSNILIARVAREMFGIEKVVARIYDPRRAAIYQRLGIATDPTSRYILVERRVPAASAGQSVSGFGDRGIRVVLLTRNGECDMPAGSTLIQEGDTLHLLGTPADINAYDSSSAPNQGGHS